MAKPMPKTTQPPRAPANDQSKQAIDPVALSHAMTNAMDRSLPLIKEYMEKRGQEDASVTLDPLLALQERFVSFMAVLLSNPRRLAELQFEYWKQCAGLWQN